MIKPLDENEVFDVLDERKGYLISNYGRCYSLKTNKFLKPNLNNRGYQRFDIKYIENGRIIYRKQVFAHLEVVKHFGDCNGNTISDLEKFIDILNIDHRDRNKFNNRQSNLQITSARVNQLRKFVCYEDIDSIYDDIFWGCMNLESINLTEAIFIVSSYKKSLKELAKKIRMQFTLQEFIFASKQIKSIGSMLDSLNLEYKTDLKKSNLTLRNKFDKDLKVTVKLKREN